MSHDLPGRHQGARHPERRSESQELADQRRQLNERARALGATADELEAALETLALQAEEVLYRLRGGSLH
jgi:hypothetical protein